MTGLTRESFFETLYAASSPGEQLKITVVDQEGKPVLKKPYDTEPITPSLSEANLSAKNTNVYFTAIPRRGEELGRATLVWLDRDDYEIPLETLVASLRPQPTAVVNSGHGWHVYWALTAGIDFDRANTFQRLLQKLFAGDAFAWTAERSMRVPFSWNAKKGKPPAYCELRLLEERLYDPDDLQDELIAAAVLQVWGKGSRQMMALGLGALLSRASYSLVRAEAIIRLICGVAEDEEVNDRVRAVLGTIDKGNRGQSITAGALYEALERETYGAILGLLGIVQSKGDLVYEGEKIGSEVRLQASLSHYLYTKGDWTTMEGGQLYLWNEKFWEESSPMALRGYVIDVLRAIKHTTESGVETPLNFDDRVVREIADLINSSCQYHKLTPPVSSLIFLKNGVVDLETGNLYPHSREHGNRWVLDFDYDPQALCPVWDRFITFAVQSPDFLQEWLGNLLLTENPWQKMLWLYGSTGTGKSTFLKVVEGLFGPAHASVDPHNLGEYQLAKLSTMKVATSSELDLSLLKTGRLKALVSGDALDARFPYGRPFKLEFKGKLVFASNGLATVGETDGYYRRLDIVPFNNAPSPEEKDPQIWMKLKAELPGIFNWAMEGWRRQQQFIETKSWAIPEEVTEENRKYESTSDQMRMFFGDSMELDPQAEEPASNVYAAYRNWTQQNGFPPLPHSQKFSHELRRMGLSAVGPKSFGMDGRKIRGWKGARIRAGRVSVPITDEREAERLIRESTAFK